MTWALATIAALLIGDGAISLAGSIFAGPEDGAGDGDAGSRAACPEHWVRRTTTPHPKYSSTSRDVKARSVPT